MSSRFFSYPNRYLCSVLDDIIKCDETRNYSAVKGLAEEARILGGRMESALEDNGDIKRAHEEIKALKKEIKKLEKKKEELEDETKE